MTRKEAIEILSCYYEVGNAKQNDALDMAIDALKEPEKGGNGYKSFESAEIMHDRTTDGCKNAVSRA